MKRLRPIAAKAATAAYRADVAGRPRGFGEQDDAWITVATLLEHAGQVEGADRAELCRRAHAIAKETIERAGSQYVATVEWRGRTASDSDFVVLLADQAYEAGALNMSVTMLSGLLNADHSMTTLQTGIALSRLARATSKLGHMDIATDQHAIVAQLGREHRIPELEVRGWIGLGGMAQSRGNYPEMGEFAERARELAEREGLTGLARFAHNGLMIVNGVQDRFDEALVHGWAAFRASVGDPLAEAESVQNLGQLLLLAGRVAEARAAFSAVLARRMPVRVVLLALGGLALASAGTGDVDTVAWAASEVERLAEMPLPRHPLAIALLECATAAMRVTNVDTAERLRRQTKIIADTHGFHEVAIRAEALVGPAPVTPLDATVALGRRAAEVAEQVKWMEPERLPDHVLVGAAPE